MTDTALLQQENRSLRRRILEWPLDFWFRRISEARFLLWQRAFALTFIIFVSQWSYYGAEWLTDVGYHISAKATDTVYPAPYPTLPQWALIPFLVAMFGSATLVMLNLAGRIPKVVVLACAIYIQVADQISSFTLNKLYIVGFFLIAFAPRTVSEKSAQGERRFMSAWPVRVLQATLLIQYGEAGICKAYHGDWLHKVDILYGHSVGIYRTEIAGWLMTHMPPIFWVASSLFALAFELFAPVIFAFRRLRPFAMLSGVAMHLVIAALMKDLIFFSLQMITFYVVFLRDETCVAVEQWLSQLVARFRPKRPVGRES